MPESHQGASPKVTPILFSAAMIRALLDSRKTQTRRVIKPQPFKVEAGFPYLPPVNDATGCTFTPIGCPFGKPGDLLAVKEAAWMWCERRPNGFTKAGRSKWHYIPLEAAPMFYQADHPKKPLVSITHPETGNLWGWRLKIARFMPRCASRLTLELTDVRVQRLQDISEKDSIAEGAISRPGCSGFFNLNDGWSMDWSNVGAFSRFAAEGKLKESEVCLATARFAFAAYINELHGGRNWNLKSGLSLWDQNPWVFALSFNVHQQNIDAFLEQPRAA